MMQSLIGDAAHSMEESIEVKGRAAIPGLDMVYTFMNLYIHSMTIGYGVMQEVTGVCVCSSST